MAEKRRTAVVLSGGGAHGAYEVGVLKALVEGRSPATGHEPLEPDVWTGTSVGSFNVAYLVSRWEKDGAKAVEKLEKLWRDKIAGGWHTNGVFRLRANPVEVLDPSSWLPSPMRQLAEQAKDAAFLSREVVDRGVHAATSWDETLEQRLVELFNLSTFVSTKPLKELIETLDFAAIRTSPKVLQIAATNWTTGELRLFGNADMKKKLGAKAILASTAIPGFFPPVTIGKELYCDGGVLENTPLRPAIEAGADELHVVYLDPDVKTLPPSHLRNTYSTLMRMMQIDWAAELNDDIEDAARINRGLAVLRSAREGEPPSDADARTIFETAAELGRFLDLGGKTYRPLTIRRYHPRKSLGGSLGILDFSKRQVKAMIKQGYKDTIHHDAEAAGDVLP